MPVQVVVDIGNSRMKWGRCDASGVAEVVSLPHDDANQWHRQADAWQLTGPWAVGSVHPRTCSDLVEWIRHRGQRLVLLDGYRSVPIEVRIDAPERVGIDRLFNAIAARGRVQVGQAALIIDAGSAVTVDLLDEAGSFRGGAILPGLGLMARALHDHTAQLPLVTPRRVPNPPATNTETAIETGIVHAVLGGIERLLAIMLEARPTARVLFTGGDAALLSTHLKVPHAVVPLLTLEGIRLAADARETQE
jgi:type III pantothenate kinase